MSSFQVDAKRPLFPSLFLENIFNNLRIRQLFLSIVCVPSLISVLAITWNASLVVDQYHRAQQMAGSSAVVLSSLALLPALASERGMTASMLASPKQYSEENKKRLSQFREETDRNLRMMYEELDAHPELPSLSAVYQHLGTLSEGLSRLRQQADDSFHPGKESIDPHRWLLAITRNIEELRIISRILTVPIKEEDHASAYGVFIKEFFFKLSENAGLERVLIAIRIAQESPLSSAEYQALENYQYINLSMLQQINEVMEFFPQTPEISLAQTEIERSYNQDYLSLRSSIIQSSLAGRNYPVTVFEWFESATKAINAIQNYSYAINQHISADIEIIKNRSRNTIIGLVVILALVVIVFVLTLIITFRRILVPLLKLEVSAQTIAKGDFARSLHIAAKDEFGDVAQAFEVMRTYLFHDRNKRQKAENELRKLNTVIEQSVSSVIIVDVNGITEYVNPQFSQTTGYQADEVLGCRFNFLASGHTPKATYADLWNTIRSGEVWSGELLNKKKNGELYWDQVSISPVHNQEGKNTHFISTQHDISERKALEERLDFLAQHDELTELPNRVLLADRFSQQVVRARRANSQVALLVVGLDRLKQINDSIGHATGDQLLIEVAKRLKGITRSCDTLARYSGDEFIILAENISSIENLIGLVNGLMDAFIEPVRIEQHEIHATASIGISTWPDDGEDLDTLIRKSDAAMNHAKTAGIGQFQFFTQEMNQRINQRLQMENDLRKAKDNQELILYYQPQVDLTSGKIVGAEALLRWRHPELGMISPLQFIPLAEETNLIRPIGKWVLQTACAQLQSWKKAGHKDISVAVNVSVCQLESDQFIPCLTEVLEQSGIDPAHLEIEITESSVMSQPEKMREVLNKVKQLGIKLALDDFGTGYSSLSYLRRFPFDKLKIDRSFIQEITHKPEDVAIAVAITEMAHALKMTVLAEGVETELQADYMRRCDCDEIQGYLISKPVPASEFEQLLNQS